MKSQVMHRIVVITLLLGLFIVPIYMTHNQININNIKAYEAASVLGPLKYNSVKKINASYKPVAQQNDIVQFSGNSFVGDNL